LKHPILIQGAMDSELTLLIQATAPHKFEQVGNFRFWKGAVADTPVVICKTGIGVINAAAATALAVQRYSPRCILNQGTAGAHTRALAVGDVIVGEQVCYLSSFSTERSRGEDPLNPWKPAAFQSPEGETISYHANEVMLRAAKAALADEPRVTFGCIGSGDLWTRDPSSLQALHDMHGTLCEEMEAAAVYLTANNLGVPVLSIRVISNNEGTGEPFDPNSALRAQELTLKLLSFLHT